MLDDVMAELEVLGLEQKVLRARSAYYNGTPIMSDEEFDSLIEELKEASPDSLAVTAIGSPVEVTEWVKVAHTIPMGSLDKVQSEEDFEKWAERVPPGTDLLESDKLDGISISVTYRGDLVEAVTRGEGTEGEEISVNVARMKGLPSKLPFSDEITVRGEIVVHRDILAKHFPDQVSTRNTAAGTAKRYDGRGCEHLNVYFYQVFGPTFERDSEQYEWLAAHGFAVPRWKLHKGSPIQDVIQSWKQDQEGLRDELPYDIDGKVVRVNDLNTQLELGELHGRPKGAVAFKYLPLVKTTTAVNLICQVGGTGKITPVGVVEPTKLLGAEVRRASLYNWAYVKQIGFHIGARVTITRANDVIPRIASVISEPQPSIDPPTHCPVCATPTEWDGEYLICPNTAECLAQLEGRLKKWVKELGILEWGDVLIEKIVAERLTTDVPGLYRLTPDQLAALDRMGDTSAKKAVEQLRKVLPIPLEQFIGSLGIPLCATGTMGKVVSAGYNTIDKLKAASFEQLQDIEGMGPKRARALHGWLFRNASLLDDMLAVGITIKDRVQGTLTGKSFCFTGAMKNKRPYLAKLAQEAGGEVKDNAGKGLTFLVIADPNSTSSKAVSARKNGTTCISEEEFLAMAGV